MSAIEVANLHKTYKLGKVEVPVLRGVSLDIESGQWLAILGASGSGKSTLLHLLGGLDRPDAKTGGSIAYDGRKLGALSSSERNQFRRDHVGFVFQFYHLVPELTVLENTLLGAMIRLGRLGYMREASRLRDSARQLLDKAGLSHRLAHKPAQLSGGERQRVAIARAIVGEPALILADEPTGALDTRTGIEVMRLFREINQERGTALVIVTHDPHVAEQCPRRVVMSDGRLVDDNGAFAHQVRPAA